MGSSGLGRWEVEGKYSWPPTTGNGQMQLDIRYFRDHKSGYEPASDLEGVGCASVVQIVTETSNQHSECLGVGEVFGDVDDFANRVEEVADTEGMHPVVVGWISVPSAQNCKELFAQNSKESRNYSIKST